MENMKKYKPDYFLALSVAIFELGFWAICFFLPMMYVSASGYGFVPLLLTVSAPFLILFGGFFVIYTVLNLIFGIFHKPHVCIDGEKIILGKSELDGRRIDTIKMDFGTWVSRGTVQPAKVTLFSGICETEIKHPSIMLLFALKRACKKAKFKTGLVKRLVIVPFILACAGAVLAFILMK